MRIGITGAAGFIGGHVIETALSLGHSVVAFDRSGKARTTSDRIETMLGDVRDATAMTELAAHTDGIIHLAACLGTQETIANPRPAAETNIVGGLNFLEACAQYKLPGVYIGVGNHWMENTYSISKTTIERFVRMFNQDRNGLINVVRLVNAYGPRQSVAPPFGPAKVRKITPSFICRALTGKPIEVYGDGEQISDMVHVRDGATALVLALEAAAAGNVFRSPIEVGPPPHLSRTVNQVAHEIVEATVELGFEPVPLLHLPMRPGEIAGARVSADPRTLSLIGIDASELVPLEGGIRDTVRWYVQHWLPDWQARR